MRPPWKIAYRTERHPISSRLIGDWLAEKEQSDDSKSNRRNGRHRPTRTTWTPGITIPRSLPPPKEVARSTTARGSDQ